MDMHNRYLSVVTALALTAGAAWAGPLTGGAPKAPKRADTHFDAVDEAKLVVGKARFAGPGVLVDLDLDGAKDLVSGSSFFLDPGGPISALLLDRDGRRGRTLVLPSPSTNPAHSFPIVVCGDLDHDGLPDLVAIGTHGGIGVLRHLGLDAAGLPTFARSHFVPKETEATRYGGFQLHTRVARLADVDLDGDLDLLLAGEVVSPLRFHHFTGLLLFPGDGRGGFGSPWQLVDGRILDHDRADLDGDGVLDLAVLDGDGRVHTLFLGAKGKVDERVFTAGGIGTPCFLRLGQVAGGERPDYIVLGEDEDQGMLLGVWPSLGRSVGLGSRQLALDHQALSLDCGDLDGNGRIDLAMLAFDGSGRTVVEVRYGEDEGFGKATPLSPGGELANGLSSQGTSFVKLDDLDADGALDLVLAPVRGTGDDLGLAWWKGRGTARPSRIPLGTATAGAGGRVPEISGLGDLVPGNADHFLRLAGVPAGRIAWLWLSPKRLDVVLYGLHLKVFPFRSIGVPTRGQGEAGGWASLRLPIPPDPGLKGSSLFVQWVMADAAAPNPLGLARSEALELVVGG